MFELYIHTLLCVLRVCVLLSACVLCVFECVYEILLVVCDECTVACIGLLRACFIFLHMPSVACLLRAHIFLQPINSLCFFSHGHTTQATI